MFWDGAPSSVGAQQLLLGAEGALRHLAAERSVFAARRTLQLLPAGSGSGQAVSPPARSVLGPEPSSRDGGARPVPPRCSALTAHLAEHKSLFWANAPAAAQVILAQRGVIFRAALPCTCSEVVSNYRALSGGGERGGGKKDHVEKFTELRT